MIKTILTPLVFVLPAVVFAQDAGFPFGKVNAAQLAVTTYPLDSTAEAVVMAEFGKAWVDYENPNRLRFQYHTKIKILKQNAVSKADIEIPLYKQDGKEEVISHVVASAFNAEGNSVQESKLQNKSIFTAKNDKYYNVVKFAIPNVKVGTIIEYQYEIGSPFLWNFKNWEFQSEMPKVRSEYQTVIPANYRYNVTLRGYLKLDSHESDIMRECLSGGNGSVADCAVNKYVMTNIPAFKEEEYMTSKFNFISKINFELSEITAWDGRKFKYTKEWKDADTELKTSPDFGIQLKRGKDVVDGAIDAAVLGETDPLTKAKKIYDFVKFHYRWNGFYGDRSDLGIKKAFDEKKGNVGDINLTLIAALRYAGYNVDPVLLATRSLGRPIELHPVLSDFNYVIARLTLDNKIYLLDAVDDFLPFGSISKVCYNGIGRVIAPDGSFWMNIDPTDKDRTIIMIDLKLSSDGVMTGTISESTHGYAAIEKRKDFAEFQDQKGYLDNKRAKHDLLTFTSYERTGEHELDKPVVEKFGVEFSAFDAPGVTDLIFNPFVMGRNRSNPFKTETRMFPVDYGVPHEENATIVIELPEDLEVTSLPDKVGLALPNGGGRYIFGAQVMGNKLTVTNVLSIARPVYSAGEYPFLREMYTRMLQAQNTDVIFHRKE